MKFIHQLRNRFGRFNLDWDFIRGSAALSVGMAVARVLGLAFSLLLAASFSPDDYGIFQYGLMLGLIFCIGTHPFGQHVIARFIAKHSDGGQLTEVLTNSWVALLLIMALTLLIVIPVMLFMGIFDIGILFVVFGVTIFYAYWGVARGLQASNHLTIAFLASNFVQLAATFVLIYWLEIQSATLALSIYGLSYLIPLVLMQYFAPLSFGFQFGAVSKDMLLRLLKFSVPIWMSHAAFTFYVSMDILLLEALSDSYVVGIYAATRTTNVVFSFIPMGFSILIMPKAAILPREAYTKLLKKSLLLGLFINIIGFVIYISLIRWFIDIAFGAEYVASLSVYAILAIASIISSSGGVVGAALMGAGSPQYETVSNILGLIAIVILGLWLIPVFGLVGIAIAAACGSVMTVLPYTYAAFRVFRDKPEPVTSPV